MVGQLRFAKETGFEEGRKEGLKEGLKEGKQEEKYAVIKRMASKGYPLEVIAEIAGLTAMEVREYLDHNPTA